MSKYKDKETQRYDESYQACIFVDGKTIEAFIHGFTEKKLIINNLFKITEN